MAPGVDRLGIKKMGRVMIEGKCGLPALPRCLAEATTPAKTGRTPFGGLGNNMMRRMIGRYKGCRCARMGRASRGAGAVFNGAGDAVANTHCL